MNRLLLVFALILGTVSAAFAQAIKVEVKLNEQGNWQLLRGGAPYYIKGAGGHTQLDKLVSIGGNSIRTWSTDNAKEILDAAQEKGLTVMMGLWLQHERHGFDYDDKEKVALQLAAFRKVVNDLKDHPALLLWGVGNEVDLDYHNTNVWYAVNDVAKMIHEVDPNHPTCTVTAGFDPAECKLILERAPEIDIYGINTYSDIVKVKKEVHNAGWKGAYIISEWGPDGHWEVNKTRWGASVEQSSSEKAATYEARYTNCIAADPQQCIGSYVFLWGQKQETTSTWYGLFSVNDESVEALDRLQFIWTGKVPANSAPHLDSLKLNGRMKGEDILLTAAQPFDAHIVYSDVDKDKVKIRWQIIPESNDIRSGGDAERAPEALNGSVIRASGTSATLKTPDSEGAYRLFVTLTDNNGHFAYSNIPFYVIPNQQNSQKQKPVRFKKLTM